MPVQPTFTLGQVLWTVAGGREPSQVLIDQVRYLRQLGVPASQKDMDLGSGNRARYDYEDLLEMGVAMFAIHSGMKPREVAQYLSSNRAKLRPLYRKSIDEAPKVGRGSVGANGITIRDNELYLRLHDRFSSTPGKFESLRQDEITEPDDLVGVVERYPDGATRRLLPLSRLAHKLVTLVADAPATKPGPK